jgi:hypothetical protein
MIVSSCLGEIDAYFLLRNHMGIDAVVEKKGLG